MFTPITRKHLLRNSTLASVALLGLGLSGNALAADATADADATIMEAITITTTAQLDFGSIIIGDADVPATVNPDGSVICDPSLECTGTTSPAAFDVSGSPDATYSITLPGTVTIDNSADGGADSMDIGLFESDPDTTGTLDGSGAQTLNVGATLTVGNPQESGAYTGSFQVSVDYN